MANETQIGKLVIDLQMKTQALEKGLETAKKKLQEIEKQNDQVGDSNKKLDASYLALSATAVASLMKIGSAIKSCIEEYNSYTQAMSSLQNVSEYTGESMSEFSDIMDEFSVYMTKSDIATTIKNFSLMGFTADQTRQMMEALTNSAIRNRNANYTVSEAVRVASEGYRQGLSTLSDSAGVTENLSVMLDKYAQSIGKTASQLTEAEQNQAYLNRTMYAAEPFAGAMADYMDTLAGKQGAYNQAMRETQVAYTEAIEPLLNKFEELKIKMLSGLNDIIASNEEVTSGVTAFGVTLGVLAITISTAKKAYDAYKASTIAATISTQGFTAALAANPFGAIAIAISLVVSALAAYTIAVQKQTEAQGILNERTQQYNDIVSGKFQYTEEEISEAEKRKSEIEEEIKLLDQIMNKRQELLSVQTVSKSDSKQARELRNEIKNLTQQYEELSKKAVGSNEKISESLKDLHKELKAYNEVLSDSDVIKNISKAFDTETIRQQQEEAAQLKLNAQTMQNYLDIVKNGDKTTTEYQNAVSELSKAYPEAASAGGLLTDFLDGLISAEEIQAEEAWNASQISIQGHIQNIQQALEDESVQRQVAANMGIAYDQNFRPKLEAILALLQTIGGYQPDQVPNIAPKTVTTPKRSSTASTYSNKALDNYKKQIEHKKAMDQISLREEISMYQTALQKYTKTTDEKRELMEKIYSLQKELQDKTLDDYISEIEYRKSLDQLSLKDEIAMYQTALQKYAKTAEDRRELTTTIYELQKEFQEEELNNYIEFVEHKKALDQKSLEEEINDYEWAYNHLAVTTEQKEDLEERLYSLRKELAQKNKDLLDQQTKDYEDYIEEQKQLRGAEYDVKEQENDLNKIIELHRNYLDQIMKDERLSLDERKELYQEELDTIKSYEEQKRDLRVQSVDDTVSQLTNAITKQLEEMEEADRKAIEENIDLVEKWKDARISAINEEYDARIEAIQKELDLLDESEEEKTRAEEDAEYERKKNRLEELLAFEHDATTKANYQQELDKLITEYQKTLDKRALEDKKESLKEQQELIKEEQNSKIEAIEEEADKQKEVYENQLDELEKYYKKQKDLAQETAEKMLLNVEQNQKQILNLLNSYGDAYEITGQSLGEKLAQGINNGIADKIQNMIQKLQDTIDAGIERKIKEWTSGNYEYEAGANKPQTKTINVYQTNNIEQTPEMPSETYRKMKNINEQLAAELAGL